MAVKVSWPINSVYHEKGREEIVLSWPRVFYDCSYFRYVEEGPHRKDQKQAHRQGTGWSSSLTSRREREEPESQEISGMGRMDAIQALRASLAGKWISDEHYGSVTLEPT